MASELRRARVAQVVVVLLVAWVVVVAVRIEVLNAVAGTFLPRQDAESGKWRVRADDSASHDLREAVATFGQLQYLVALLLLALSALELRRSADVWGRALAGSGVTVAIGALGLAVYRGYFSSLGW